MGGRTFLDHGLDVGAVQRRRPLETVEHDADGAAVSARADDDTFPAGEIRASRRAEGAHSDACQLRYRWLLIGRLWCLPTRDDYNHPCGRGDRASSATRPQEAAGNDTKIPHAQEAREGFPVQDISPRLQRWFVGNHGMPHYRRYIAAVPLF